MSRPPVPGPPAQQERSAAQELTAKAEKLAPGLAQADGRPGGRHEADSDAVRDTERREETGGPTRA
jgi:hypothetical protein